MKLDLREDDDSEGLLSDGDREESEGDVAGVTLQRKRRVITACGFILGNEVCERLAYYGIQTNMGIFLKQYMGYPTDRASQLLQAWKATVHLTPLLGAYLADAYMGRFWVILVFSIIYLIGMAGVTAVNLAPSIRPRYLQPPASGDYLPTRNLLWAFLYLVALGSGGIKPCVSSFGGDQFDSSSQQERKWRSSFFNWLYFAINVGSLAATLVVVPVQEMKGYSVGFGIPTVAMAASIALFLAGSVVKLYTLVPPEGSPFFRIYHVLRAAFINRKEPLPEDPKELYEPPPGEKGAVAFRMGHTHHMRALDRAAIRKDPPGKYQVSLTEVEETKSFMAIMPIFLCVCIWQMTYDPIFSLLPFPGDVMDRRLGSSGFKIPASSISFANTFGVLLSIPLYDMVVVPLAVKMGRPISLTARVGIGFLVQLAALLSAGFIEMARYSQVRSSGLIERWNKAVAANPDVDYTDPEFMQPMSIWYQFIPYFLLGASEVFTNVGVLDLFFTQVSDGMKALGASFYLLTVAIGTYMASALNIIIAGLAPGDPWVADNPLFGHYDRFFFLNAAILVMGLLAYLHVTRDDRDGKPTGPHDVRIGGLHRDNSLGADQHRRFGPRRPDGEASPLLGSCSGGAGRLRARCSAVIARVVGGGSSGNGGGAGGGGVGAAPATAGMASAAAAGPRLGALQEGGQLGHQQGDMEMVPLIESRDP